MSRVSSLSRTSYAALIALSLVSSSAAPVLADSNANSTRGTVDTQQNRQVVSVASFQNNDLARQSAQKPKPWPAPVGHRQPRASDVAATAQLSTANAEEERLDQELKAKLIICRGC